MLRWSNFRHGIAAEPDLPSRQLQEKAGGVMPAGLFSCRNRENHGAVNRLPEQASRLVRSLFRFRWRMRNDETDTAWRDRDLSDGACNTRGIAGGNPRARHDRILLPELRLSARRIWCSPAE